MASSVVVGKDFLYLPPRPLGLTLASHVRGSSAHRRAESLRPGVQVGC